MGQRIKGRKRFYKHVSVRMAARESPLEMQSYEVLLDGRPIKPRPGVPLRVPTAALAIGIAGEWARQVTILDPTTMPLMTLASTAQDLMPSSRPEVIRSMLRYAETDVTCVRDNARPSFVKRQEEHWDPLLEMLDRDYGIRFNLMYDVNAIPQPEETFAFFRAELEKLDNWRLQAVNHVTNSTKSIVAAFLLQEGKITAHTVWDVARVEEEFNIDEWGLVEGGHDVDRAHLRVQVHGAALFLDLLNDASPLPAAAAGSGAAAQEAPPTPAAADDLEEFLRELEGGGDADPAVGRG